MSRLPVTSRQTVGKADRQQVFVRRRIEAVAGLMALGIVMLGIRAVDLQWIQADKLSNMAEKQRYRQYSAVAPRGSITDAKGRTLAESVETASIAVMADEIPSDKIAPLAKALNMSEKAVARKIHGRKGFVWLARQITPTQTAAVAALDIPGVRQESEWRRYHPMGPETGHLLGFVGVDGHGLEGLERALDDQLSGEAGIRQVRRDARGHSLPGGIWLRDPVPGKSINLTLDATIQSIAYAALADGIRKQKGQKAAPS